MLDTATSKVQASPVAAAEPDSGTNNDSIVQFWSGNEIFSLAKSDEIKQALARWNKLVATKLPRLNEFLGPNPASVLNNAMLLIPIPADLLFVHHGAGAAKMIGANFTGMLHSERSNPTAAAIRKVYLRSVELGQPYYLRFVSPYSQQHFSLEQIVLPLAADEQREIGFALVYTAPMDDQIEVLRAVFERSPIGMIAAMSQSDANGKLAGGRVLLINAKARQVLRIPPDNKSIVMLSDLGTWFKEGALWTKTNMTMESGQTHVLYRDLSNNKNFRVTIEPIDRFLLFSIIEIAMPED